MRDYHILVKNQPKQVGLFEWASWFEDSRRSIMKTDYAHKRKARYANPKARRVKTAKLSSVFIGLKGEMFEAMFFCDGHDLDQSAFRTESLRDCQRMHRVLKTHITVTCHRWLDAV